MCVCVILCAGVCLTHVQGRFGIVQRVYCCGAPPVRRYGGKCLFAATVVLVRLSMHVDSHAGFSRAAFPWTSQGDVVTGGSASSGKVLVVCNIQYVAFDDVANIDR